MPDFDTDKWPKNTKDNEEYETLIKLLGIKQILDENIVAKHIFSTSIFIPMEYGNINSKMSLYYTGFIKNIELFKDRVEDPDNSLLYIYYDDMIDKFAENPQNFKTMYQPSGSNNEYDSRVKTAFKTNNDKIEILLELYALAIDKIKTDRDRYKHIRLFSFNCDSIPKKTKFYGHPETFGSIVRMVPIYDTRIEQTTMINISHAITPRLARILTVFSQLPNRYLLSTLTDYKGQLDAYHYYSDLATNGVFAEGLSYQKYNPQILTCLAAGLTSVKNNQISTLKLSRMILGCIAAQKANPRASIFKYGIDEILLSNLFLVQDINLMNIFGEVLTGTIPKMMKRDAGSEFISTYLFGNIAYLDHLTRDLADFLLDSIKGVYRYWPRPTSQQAKNLGQLTPVCDNNTIEMLLGSLPLLVEDASKEPEQYISGFSPLLYGYDELKPIFLDFTSKDEKTTPAKFDKFFTVLPITKSPKELSADVFAYMADTKLVIREPYKILDNFTYDKFSDTAPPNLYGLNRYLPYKGHSELTKKDISDRTGFINLNPDEINILYHTLKGQNPSTHKQSSGGRLLRYFKTKTHKTKKHKTKKVNINTNTLRIRRHSQILASK